MDRLNEIKKISKKKKKKKTNKKVIREYWCMDAQIGKDNWKILLKIYLYKNY